jgi:hypothetical protein
MLRYFCPAITLPNAYGLVKKPPDGNPRKNLTLVAKILQKLANGESFQTETPHLMPMNAFINKNQQNLFNYLKVLTNDPQAQEGKNPFFDLQKVVTFEDIHLRKFNIEDLTFIHELIFEYVI